MRVWVKESYLVRLVLLPKVKRDNSCSYLYPIVSQEFASRIVPHIPDLVTLPSGLVACIWVKPGRLAIRWSSANLVKEGEARTEYLEAIRAGDDGTSSRF